MAFKYPHTCPEIDRKIDYLHREIKDLLDNYIPDKDFSENEIGQIYKDYFSDTIEYIRETNSDMRTSAEDQIEELENQISKLENETEEYEYKIEELEYKIKELVN